MDTISKFRTNFLGKSKSFNIGFNNRSPFDYQSSMPTNFISIPTISASPGDYALSGESNYSSYNSGGAEFTQGLINIGKAIVEKKKDKKDDNKTKVKSKKLKPGSKVQKYIDPKGYQSYITARDEAKIKDVDWYGNTLNFKNKWVLKNFEPLRDK